MKKEKTLFKKISNYVEGNLEMLKASTGFSSPHLLEQVEYRKSKCQNDCAIKGKCQNCQCSYPGILYVKESCNNGERFPDLMSRLEWEQFKENNE